ncbi:hypothetical protein ACFV3R_33060 [Streptomyces sp. NPDC059740]|uniref:hypothetical protein n=1 Tax=Streptomyces sp. NPDC059740 TaxID=3346926 RepID=UPI0036690A2E
MGWRDAEFGASHEGWAGAVLADGSEPKPVYLDLGSGTQVHQTREWWAYDGALGRPAAARCRAACACGWRGPDRPLPADEPDGPGVEQGAEEAYEDWRGHIETVERKAVPLPTELTETIERLHEHLTTAVKVVPVAALRAVASLERLTAQMAAHAAWAVEEDELSWETIGTALGLDAPTARTRVTSYQLRTEA